MRNGPPSVGPASETDYVSSLLKDYSLALTMNLFVLSDLSNILVPIPVAPNFNPWANHSSSDPYHGRNSRGSLYSYEQNSVVREVFKRWSIDRSYVPQRFVSLAEVTSSAPHSSAPLPRLPSEPDSTPPSARSPAEPDLKVSPTWPPLSTQLPTEPEPTVRSPRLLTAPDIPIVGRRCCKRKRAQQCDDEEEFLPQPKCKVVKTSPSRKCASDEASDDEASDDEASNDEASNDEASNDEASHDEISDDEASDDEASDDEASDDEACDDEASEDADADGDDDDLDDDDYDDETKQKVANSRTAKVALSRRSKAASSRAAKASITGYECFFGDCHMKFKSSKDRLRHLDTHFDPVWHCPGCSKLFSRKDALLRHLRSMPDCLEHVACGPDGGIDSTKLPGALISPWKTPPGIKKMRIPPQGDPARDVVLKLRQEAGLD
ncbi:hypothetical protein SCP_1102150 [Sparassis crispa]|uniref:C2H2-type domain-containing protein n=1 Tax=Sparassis crispa TaxID=139825 RepID=A0A401GZF6_9APHY|nr:hypothetical protein SCP_1102150 [Sparassis crispa]GBE87538.1 hypothetical protein SCP_1102150 [Sparassis crispa]